MLSSPMHQWQLLNTNLIWAYHGPVLPRFRSTYVAGSFVAIWRILKGGVTLSWGHEQLKLTCDEWVLVPPGHVHQNFADDAEIWSVRFVVNTSANQCLLDTDTPFVLSSPSEGLVRACQVLIDLVQKRYGLRKMQLLESECTMVEFLEMEAVYRKFLSEVLLQLDKQEVPLRPLGLMDRRLQRCIWEVQNAPLSKRYTEEHMAGFAGVSVSQLNRLFQEQFGHTSRVWLDNYRYMESQRLLEANKPIKEVSYGLGFSSPQHFASWFRNRSGMTPTAWRKGH